MLQANSDPDVAVHRSPAQLYFGGLHLLYQHGSNYAGIAMSLPVLGAVVMGYTTRASAFHIIGSKRLFPMGHIAA